jgi:hypothetical protein
MPLADLHPIDALESVARGEVTAAALRTVIDQAGSQLIALAKREDLRPQLEGLTRSIAESPFLTLDTRGRDVAGLVKRA